MIARAGKTIFGRLRLSEPITAVAIQNFVLGRLVILVTKLVTDSFEKPP